MIYKLNIKTHAQTEFQEITAQIREVVKESKIESGICIVYVPHTTAGVMINEHADPDVVEDIAAQLEKLAPRHAAYKHGEGNAAAHIKASLIGTSATVPIQYGDLALGTWQGIFFGEFDGPRNRNVLVKIIGDQT
ncbi:MAG: secondary thiamine-phosphate synthase enzyme YjbQ [Dehalococcoidales bacterium]